MIVNKDNTYIKITELPENKKAEPVIPQILGKKALVEKGKKTLVEREIEPVSTVVLDLPLTEKQRAEVELLKQLINS